MPTEYGVIMHQPPKIKFVIDPKRLLQIHPATINYAAFPASIFYLMLFSLIDCE